MSRNSTSTISKKAQGSTGSRGRRAAPDSGEDAATMRSRVKQFARVREYMQEHCSDKEMLKAMEREFVDLRLRSLKATVASFPPQVLAFLRAK